jgi:hypothetical protein
LGIEVNNLVMSRLELEEAKAVGVRTDDYCKPVMPMTILEESLDFSWMENEDARFIGEMMACTDVGPVRDQLGKRLVHSLVEEFVDPAVNEPALEDDLEGSIFDYGSSLGLLPADQGDRWVHDAIAATWTRIIVVPRKRSFHPSEDSEDGPLPGDLGDSRVTITSDGKVTRDSWRRDAEEGPEEWTGTCIFRESWSSGQGIGPAGKIGLHECPRVQRH